MGKGALRGNQRELLEEEVLGTREVPTWVSPGWKYPMETGVRGGTS